MRFSRILLLRAITLIVSFFLFLFLGSILYLVFVNSKGSRSGLDDYSTDDTYLHRYYTYDANNKKLSIGIARLNTQKESEFHQIVNDEYALVSSFQNTGFGCTGSCFCLDNRRTSSSAMGTASRTLFFMVASISSVFALKRAEEYFQETCEKDLITECANPVNIISTVESCSELGEDEHEEEEKKSPLTDKEIDAIHGKIPQVYPNFEDDYTCTGTCVNKIEMDNMIQDSIRLGDDIHVEMNPEEIIRLGKKVRCKSYSMTATVRADEILDNTALFQEIEGPEFIMKNVAGGTLKGEEYAEKAFARNHLSPFCMNMKGERIGVSDILGVFSFCEGWEGETKRPKRGEEWIDFERGLNPSVRCVPEV